MTAAAVPARPILALPAFAGLALLCASVAFVDDPFEPLAWLLCAGTGLAVAVSPLRTGLPLAVATVAFGALGRLAVFELGPKSVYLRAEEAAALGLWVACGPGVVRAALSDASPRGRTVRALAWFLGLSGALLAASAVRWGVAGIATGTLYWLRFALLSSFLVASWSVASAPDARARLSGTVLGSTLALALLGLVQLALLPDMHDLKTYFPAVNRALTDPHQRRLVSTVLDPNLLGAMLVAGASLAFARVLCSPRGERLPAIVAVLVLAVATGLTVSRGAVLGLVVAFAAVAVAVRPVLAWLSVPAVAGVVALAPRVAGRFTEALWSPSGIPASFLGLDLQPEPSAFARLQSWLAAWDVVRTAPLQGVGYNNLARALAEVGDSQAVFAGTDSSLLLVLATSGAAGLASIAWVLWSIASDGWRSRGAPGADRALGAGTVGAVASLLVTSTFTNALLFPPVLALLWTLGGLAAHASTAGGAQPPGEDGRREAERAAGEGVASG